MEFLVLFMIHLITYWASSVFLFDSVVAALRPCNVPIDVMVKNVKENQFCAVLPSLMVYSLWLEPRGSLIHMTGMWSCMKLVFFLLTEHFTHYIIHIFILHNSNVAWCIHKKHHEMVYAMSFGALYGHAFDAIMNFIVPSLMGPVIFGASVGLMRVWMACSTLLFVCNHDPGIMVEHHLRLQ